MTDENIHLDVVNGIISVLRTNITDPDTIRSAAGKHFIYPDLPRVDASMPRISVTQIPAGSMESLDIETNISLHTLVLQTDIWCDIHGKFTISAINYSNTKLRDYLAGQITKVMFKKRKVLTSYNIYDVRQRFPFGSLDSGKDDLIRASADFEVDYLNLYT